MKMLFVLGFLGWVGSGALGAEFVAPIEKAHRATDWYAKEGVKARLELVFGGAPRFAGTLLMRPHAGETRLTLDDGTTIGFDGKDGWMTPKDSAFGKPRFHALTWAYFLAAPYKLSDRGTKIEPLGRKELQGKEYETARLTFAAGTGDAPDDWYLLYRDPESGRLAAMAYIVTYGGGNAKEAEPHALTYENYEDVEGIPVPMLWKLWEWSEESGLGKPLGEVKVSGLEFVKPPAGAFAAPAGAKVLELPE